MKIWCLFSIDNDYNQPKNNLVAWWKNKPNKDQLSKALGVSENDALASSNEILSGKEVRVWDADYRLEEVREGLPL